MGKWIPSILCVCQVWLLCTTTNVLAQSSTAAVTTPTGAFIGRVQFAQYTDHIVRISESTFSMDAEGKFLLQALDHNQETESGRALFTHLQVYYGGPLSFKEAASLWGWVGRVEALRAATNVGQSNVHLADARLGLQYNVNRLPAFASWFKEQRADLFIQMFPLHLNNDFGTWDTFTRFSKRFSSKLVTRGYVRTFSLDGYVAVVFENDLIYEVQRDFDVFLRVGKGNRDVPGISERSWMTGIGIRLNF